MTPRPLDDNGVTINKLLAEMIPCQSFAAGSNPLDLLGKDHNINMMTLENQWPPERGYPQNWRHSDCKVVAYLYVHELYNKYVELGNLAIKPNP